MTEPRPPNRPQGARDRKEPTESWSESPGGEARLLRARLDVMKQRDVGGECLRPGGSGAGHDEVVVAQVRRGDHLAAVSRSLRHEKASGGHPRDQVRNPRC